MGDMGEGVFCCVIGREEEGQGGDLDEESKRDALEESTVSGEGVAVGCGGVEIVVEVFEVVQQASADRFGGIERGRFNVVD